MRSPRLPIVSLALTVLGAGPALFAQDSSPVDTAALLKELHRIRDQQTVQSTQSRQAALKDIQSAASNPDRAVLLWEEAIRIVQFSGAAKENVIFREWKEKEGESLNSPIVRNAIRLYFIWLSITIQRDGGTSVKELLPQIFAFTKELLVDEQASYKLDDSNKNDKEAPKLPVKPAPVIPGVHHKATDDQVKRMHDSILKRGIDGSAIAQWLRLKDFINPENWEKTPGNIDGIYTNIILPELRLAHDPSALEYWDLKYNREADAATRTQLAFDLEKFTSLRRPVLMWSRAEEMLLIGYKNRALREMLSVIRGNPLHPDAVTWIARLDQLLAPPAEDAAPAAPAPAK